jgi:Concanavalin A-like lectin/glucanases superfamily
VLKKSALILGAITAMALVIAAPASASARLNGWWPFYEGSDTVAHDISGHGDNGTLSGGTHWVGGYFGTALSFDGSTGRVDVPDGSALEPTSAISIGAYVKASPGNFKYIVSKGASGCIASSYGLYTGPNGGLEFYVSQNSGLTYAQSPDAGTAMWDGNWHFVVGTYDGSDVRLYVDGVQIGSGTALTGPITYGLPSGNDLFFGHYDGCSGLDFDGSIDEPTVWGEALTPAQVSLSYKILTGLHGLVGKLSAFPS